MNDERIKTFSKQVWNLMSPKEQGNFYYDIGMTDFVGLTSKLLHLEPPTEEALDAVLDELSQCDRPPQPNLELKIGKTYKITSADNKYATCLAQIAPDRALFVSQDFGLTPFISWQYKIVDEDSIEACCGLYYWTLQDAMKELGELL